MISRDLTGLRTESRLAASPVWLRLVDTYTGRAPAGPLEVLLERRDGAGWAPLDHAYQLTGNGDLGFLDLARGHQGETGALDVRMHLTCPGSVTVTGSGQPFVEITVPTWSESAPPSPAAQEVRFQPGPAYRFGPGVPLLAGRVVDATGGPLDRVRLSVTETIRGHPVVERAMTDPGGWFRLPLRHSSGSTQVVAALSPVTRTVTVTIPDDLDSILLLTLT